jgi:hypothetical protein
MSDKAESIFCATQKRFLFYFKELSGQIRSLVNLTSPCEKERYTALSLVESVIEDSAY